MIWMLDTSIVFYLTNRKPGFEKIARRMSDRSPGEVQLSASTLAELRFGVEKSEFRSQNKAALDGLLELLRVDDFPAAAAQDFGEIKARLRSGGKTVGPYDLLIAAHARQIDAVLVTSNEREFKRVPGRSLQTWVKA